MSSLKHTPLAVWFLCWIAGFVTYFISLYEGFVPECIPFVDGCTSISRTGRYGYSYFIFKALMMPAAMVIVLYWTLTFSWLKAQGERSSVSLILILFFGVTAGLFLILYTTFLGSEGDVYRLMRRFGTIIFFLFSYIGHCLLAFRCYKLFGINRWVGWKLGLCLLVTVQLIIFAFSKQIVVDHDSLENIIEWQSAYILTFLPFLTWLLWNKTGFRIEIKTNRVDER